MVTVVSRNTVLYGGKGIFGAIKHCSVYKKRPVFLQCPTHTCEPSILPVIPRWYCDIADIAVQWAGEPPGNQTFSRICEHGPLDPRSKFNHQFFHASLRYISILPALIISGTIEKVGPPTKMAGRKKESIRIHCNTKEANVRATVASITLCLAPSFRLSTLSHLHQPSLFIF